jgi:hypothetical protein
VDGSCIKSSCHPVLCRVSMVCVRWGGPWAGALNLQQPAHCGRVVLELLKARKEGRLGEIQAVKSE